MKVRLADLRGLLQREWVYDSMDDFFIFLGIDDAS